MRFPQARLEILGYKHIAALAEKRFYADAIRSIESGTAGAFFRERLRAAGRLGRLLCQLRFDRQLPLRSRRDLRSRTCNAAARRVSRRCSPKISQTKATPPRNSRVRSRALGLLLTDPPRNFFRRERSRVRRQNFPDEATDRAPSRQRQRERKIGRCRELDRLARPPSSPELASSHRRRRSGPSADRSFRALGAEPMSVSRKICLCRTSPPCSNGAPISRTRQRRSRTSRPPSERACLLLFGPTDPAVWAPRNEVCACCERPERRRLRPELETSVSAAMN